MPSSSDGIHMIQGRVYGPAGKPVSSRLRVRLDSPSTTSLMAVTDQDGAFSFGSLQAGDYRLTVEGGSEFETAYEHPSIYREASPGHRTVKLTIFMRLKEPDISGSAPRPAFELYQKARQASRDGDSRKAIEHLTKALAIEPRFGAALNELGVQHLKTGEPDKAAEVLEAAVKIAPEDFTPRLNYGIALLNQKKFAASEEQLRAALKKSAAPTAHMYLGIALMSQQKLDDAEKELQTAVASSTNEVAVAHRYLGGIYWGKRDYKRAADELETYLKLLPKAADAERTREAIRDLRSKN